MASSEVFAVTGYGSAETVRALLRALWPHRFAGDALADEIVLGDGGCGLDSIEIAELLLECEDRFGVGLTAELFDGEPLTIGRVAVYFSRR